MTAPITAFGDRAWLLPATGAAHAAALADTLRHDLDDALEVVAGFDTVVVVHEGALAAEVVLGAIGGGRATPREPRRHVLDVTIDGEDVDEVRRRLGLGVDELVGELEAATLHVAVVGFSPGFAYLTGLAGPLASLDRRPTPRPRVPAGSLAVAAGMAAVYPQATPGGWWLLGRSDAALFDATRAAPALLHPGDEVAVRVVDHLRPLAPPTRAGRRPPPGIDAALRVASAPPLCQVVDQGRRGHAHEGVPTAGPLDPERAWLAGHIVGGAPSVLEVAGGGLTLEVLDDVVVALVDLEASVDGLYVPCATPLSLAPGQVVAVHAISSGPVGYLGVGGGLHIDEVLGSMATDALATVGPGFLAPGDLLGRGSKPASVAVGASVPHEEQPVVLRVMPGPHGDVAALTTRTLRVAAASSRVGLRLETLDGTGLPVVPGISSMPMVTGAIQVPPDGQPVILGPDHATLGGYGVVAVVIAADHGRLGRLVPGDEVVVEVVDHDQAVAAVAHRADALRRGGGVERPHH